MYGDVVLGLKPEHKDEIDPFEELLERQEARARRQARHRADRRRPARAGRASSRPRSASARGVDFPEDPHGAALGRHRRRVRVVEQRPRHPLPQAERHPRGAGARPSTCRRWCSATWASDSRHRRRLHARPGDRRERLLRRVPDERAGRGRRRRHPHAAADRASSSATAPGVYAQLLDIRSKLERHYRDMQDIEFTIEQGKLYMLQCRNGKRTGFAAVRIAVEMVGEKLIARKEALLRVEPEPLNQLLRPVFDPGREGARSTRGARCSPRGSPPAPAPRPAGSSSTPRTPRRAAARGETRDPGAHRDLARRTSAAWTRRRAS